MKSIKLILLVAFFGALLTGIYTLQNSHSVTGGDPLGTGAVGGSAQYVGKRDIKNSPYFPQLDFYNMQSTDNLLLLPKFATSQQITGYTCGPAAANMVVQHFLGQTLHDEMQVAEIMGTSRYNGTNTKGMVKYFKEINWQVRSSADSDTPKNYAAFLSFVKTSLQQNTPIIVENVEWGGHWRVIIGYDNMGTASTSDDVLIMADPFDTADHLQDGYAVQPAEKFFYMWFDHQLFSKSEQQRQWLTATPK